MADDPLLPYGRHLIEADDIEAVIEVLRGDWLTTGPTVARFEERFAEAVGARYAVSCNSGTAALHLAVLAAGLGPGDAAIVPAVTFLATANAVHYVGGEVVLADVDPLTGHMRPEHLKAAMHRARGKRLRAVLPVHLRGQSVNMSGIYQIARSANLAIIEDACHALGTILEEDAVRGRPVMVGGCQYSDLATFSLHPVKIITAGEGGMVTTNHAIMADHMRLLRSHGMIRTPSQFVNPEYAFDIDGSPNPWYAEMHEVGFNYRLNDISCALGLSQLAKLDRFVARRTVLANSYDRLLTDLAPIIQPVPRSAHSHEGLHLYVVHVDFRRLGITRAQFMTDLCKRGVGTQVHYLPLNHQPYFRNRYGLQSMPGADAYYQTTLSLPLFPGMKDSDPSRVVDALQSIVAGCYITNL